MLEASLGDDVIVRLKGGEVYDGTLAGYDQHMNLVLEDVVQLDASEEAGSGSHEEHGETTIIRGDNLVSITS